MWSGSTMRERNGVDERENKKDEREKELRKRKIVANIRIFSLNM